MPKSSGCGGSSRSAREGVRVGLLTEVGRMSETPDTAMVMCDSVKGLGITLDPSHYLYGPHAGVNFEPMMRHVYHVRLRDTTKDQLPGPCRPRRCRIQPPGQPVEQIPVQLALTVDIQPMPEVDQLTEMRRMRLLLESLL